MIKDKSEKTDMLFKHNRLFSGAGWIFRENTMAKYWNTCTL